MPNGREAFKKRESLLKKLVYFMVTLGLVTLILIIAAADVNYGYGPGYVRESYGSNSYGYGDSDYDDSDYGDSD